MHRVGSVGLMDRGFIYGIRSMLIQIYILFDWKLVWDVKTVPEMKSFSNDKLKA